MKLCPFLKDVCAEKLCMLWVGGECSIISINLNLTEALDLLDTPQPSSTSQPDDGHGQ